MNKDLLTFQRSPLVYNLTGEDLSLAIDEGHKRQDGKEISGIEGLQLSSYRDDRDAHILGCVGELVTCRALALDPLEQWSRHPSYLEVDSGNDLYLPNNQTISVKTRIPMGDWALGPGKKREDFISDFGILVWYDNINQNANVMGFFSRSDWDMDSRYINFGRDSKRWIYNGEFRPIEDFYLFVRIP